MVKKLSKWLQQNSSGSIVIGSLMIMLLFTITVLPGQAQSALKNTGSEDSPDTSLFYTSTELYQMAEAYGAEGRQAYIHARWTFDLVFPLVYVAFLSAGISWFIKTLPNKNELWELLNLIPIVGGIFDYLENTAASIVMATYPKMSFAVYLAPPFSLVKWLLIALAFGVYFLYFIRFLFSRVLNRSA
ncbi:MAG: hypothetical protein WBB69_17050 [Anaerolineales bacterium]